MLRRSFKELYLVLLFPPEQLFLVSHAESKARGEKSLWALPCRVHAEGGTPFGFHRPEGWWLRPRLPRLVLGEEDGMPWPSLKSLYRHYSHNTLQVVYWSRLLVMDVRNPTQTSLNAKGNLLTQITRKLRAAFRNSWNQKLNYFIRALSFLTSALSTWLHSLDSIFPHSRIVCRPHPILHLRSST